VGAWRYLSWGANKESAPFFICGAGRIRQMNQSVSVKNLTFLLSLPKKKLWASAASIFSFRYAAYTLGKGVKDWLTVSPSLGISVCL